jgi:hypothetical protein
MRFAKLTYPLTQHLRIFIASYVTKRLLVRICPSSYGH